VARRGDAIERGEQAHELLLGADDLPKEMKFCLLSRVDRELTSEPIGG
jgi:hypothetical protein